ncbi:MAG: c-type cytochrome [Dehalococcoidia bacterium]|jgi:hypothetical protein|nr:c-type cytochrome [Dehalococcoidia bacterium]
MTLRGLRSPRSWLVVAFAVVAFGWLSVWVLFFRVGTDVCGDASPTDEELFRCGSIGAEPQLGVPYWIWVVLPDVFPEYLPGPGGYESVGIIWEDGASTPIGVPVVEIGEMQRAGINCALCHTSSYRVTAESEPVIVLGGGSQRFDLQGYLRFLFKSSSDPRFTAGVLIPAIEEVHELSTAERLLYQAAIPAMRGALKSQSEDFAFADRNPDWGPGRIDPFNPIKFGLLGQPEDETIGNSDMMPLWNLGGREVLHWDGLNSSLTEVILSSAIGDGARPKTLDLAVMARLERYILELEVPAYPFEVDDELAAAGAALFQTHCAACHGLDGEQTGLVVLPGEVGTDQERLGMWEQKDADAYNEKYGGYDWGFSSFQDIDGYVAVPLDGLWLRAPYLHNGSVPTLRDLLELPALRPTSFYRGYDVYDPEQVGFVSDVAEDAESGLVFFLYDTTLRGNSNQGHLWGTELSANQKDALLEYLKTQ